MQAAQVGVGRTRRWRFGALSLGVLAASAFSINTAAGLVGVVPDEPPAENFAGLTKVATTADYIVVVNVLPAEEMFTEQQYADQHPTVGELVVDGKPTPRPPSSRHAEAHIYSQVTGLPVSDIRPTMRLIDRQTGETKPIDATLMQDVLIGEPDLHFGSNVVIPSGHEFTIVITIGSQEVSVDGVLL